MKKNITITLIGLFICSLLFSACGKKASEPELTPTATSTATKAPTFTPSSTITATPEPTLTKTVTPTPTIQWDNQGLSLTPLPVGAEEISAATISRLTALAVWGNGKANTITLSPDGNILGVGTTIGAYFYDSFYFSLVEIVPTPYPVHSIAFSTDAQWIALGQSAGTIDICDQQDFTFITRLTTHDMPTSNSNLVEVFFSQDSAFLSYLNQTDGKIYSNLWDSSSWLLIDSFDTDDGLISFVNPSTSLAGLIDGNQLTLQSLTYREQQINLNLPNSLPYSFWQDVSQSGGTLTPFWDGNNILINTSNIILNWRLEENDIKYVLDHYPALLPDPCLTAAESCRNSQGGFSWACPDKSNHPTIGKVSIAPDNSLFLVSRNDGRTELRRSSDGNKIWDIESSFLEFAFYPRGEVFYGLREDGTIEKRSLLTGELFFPLNQHPSQLNALQFSPDSSILAVAYSDGLVRIFSSFNGELLGVLNATATALHFSPDGSLLVAGLQNGGIRLFELNKGRYSDLPGGHVDQVTGLVFSTDGLRLFSSSLDCTISLWNVEGRHRHWNLKTNQADPFQVTGVDQNFIDDAKYIFSPQTGIFQVNYPEIFSYFSARNTSFSDFAVSPNGQFLASAGNTSWLIPLNNPNPADNSKILESLAVDGKDVLSFSPDSSVVVLSSSVALEFWSIPEAKNLGEFRFTQAGSAESTPIDLSVSPDSSLIALGKSDGLIYIFGIIP